MLFISPHKKIILAAVSIFIATFSFLIFFMSGDTRGQYMKTSIFESYFSERGETGSHGAFDSLYDATQPSIVVGGQNHILGVNAAFGETLQYAGQDIAGEDVFSLIASDDLGAFVRQYTDVISSGTMAVNAGPFRMISGDGDVHAVLVTFRALPDKHEADAPRLVLIIKDITHTLDKPGSKKAPSGSGGSDSTGGGTAPSIKEMPENKDDKGGHRIIVEKPA